MNETARMGVLDRMPTTVRATIASVAFVGLAAAVTEVQKQQKWIAGGDQVQAVEADLLRHIEVAEKVNDRQSEQIDELKRQTGKNAETLEDVEEGVNDIRVEQARQGQQLNDIQNTLDRAFNKNGP